MKPYKYNGRRVPGMYQGKFQEGKETKDVKMLKGTTVFGKTISERNKAFPFGQGPKLRKYAKKLGLNRYAKKVMENNLSIYRKIKKLFN